MEAKLSRDYFVRQAILLALFGGFSLFFVRFGVKHHIGLMVWVGVGLFLLSAGLTAWPYFHGLRAMDTEGVTRRDGRRFLWKDLLEEREVHARMPWGAPGPLNHIELVFPDGWVQVFPLTLENAGLVMRYLEERKRPKVCVTCGELKDYQVGLQVGGREEEHTFLPDAAYALETVRETQPGRNRSPVLKRCKECGTYYLFEVSYEYIVYGSEDEQRLTRLTEEQAAEYLGGAAC